jgi:hypothetical protein
LRRYSAAAAAESRRDASESMTIRLMALNKSLLDHYQTALTRRDEQRATRQMVGRCRLSLSNPG